MMLASVPLVLCIAALCLNTWSSSAELQAVPTQLYGGCEASECSNSLLCPHGYSEETVESNCGGCSQLGDQYIVRTSSNNTEGTSCSPGSLVYDCSTCVAQQPPPATILPNFTFDDFVDDCDASSECTVIKYKVTCNDPAHGDFSLSQEYEFCTTKLEDCSPLGSNWVTSEVVYGARACPKVNYLGLQKCRTCFEPGAATFTTTATTTTMTIPEHWPVRPSTLRSWCGKGHCNAELQCPLGYNLKGYGDSLCSCSQLGENWSASEWIGHWQCSYSCSTCVKDTSVETIPSVRPTEEKRNCTVGRNCEIDLSCPQGYGLTEPLKLCSTSSNCSAYGQTYLASSIIQGSRACEYVFWFEDQKNCQTCVPESLLPTPTTTTTAAPTTAPASTTGPITSAPWGRVWEHVGGPWNRACRGDNANDNKASYYEVETGVATLELCQKKCMDKLGCKGIEYNAMVDNGRCELWHRDGGIHAWAEPAKQGYTCMRYGWPAQYLFPVNGGVNQACRGDNPNDNSNSYYSLKNVLNMEDCRAECVAAPICFGIEHKDDRCEIWTRPIHASASVSGFSCLRLGWSIDQLMPMDGGDNRACRGENSTDNADSYYLVKSVSKMEECKAECGATPMCYGVEYDGSSRCEVWIRPIHASADVAGYNCMHFPSRRLLRESEPVLV
eukprot:TRINITY_DN1480_c0_g1_i1.p1 TRINITY_DN1480_c0_g1~~TRINITY_DN1480_c0_g1_i1.p1  ORF type:complete len:668 (-),score=70.26 TRINITY_DN1480_c0_g1_i1:386-2389(-)